ncbi:MAG: DNA topoisomerase I, partial [Candidatus Aenigmarchaeota archaeon]|nr:DNA topoisomerase I [Candidatus Aenigmarchaeota archaeon]
KDELKQSFENRKDGYNKGMTESGLTRHYLDYFYGVNISKALTSSIKTASDRYYLLSSGRVQGPALAILAERENEISKFVPIPFWELNFITKESDKRKFDELIFNYNKSKFWEKDEADKVFNECDKKNAVIKNIEGKKKLLNPPIPFNLTGLQMEAYKVFGYSPSRTQQIAQKLYIAGLISYPRTSSQKLPPSIDYKKIIEKLCRRFKAGEELLKKNLTPTEGKKTDSAHPAIYPTGDLPKKLGEVESKLYSLIVHRFFAVFGEPAERLSVKITANISEHEFHCTGAKTIKANWLSLYPYAKLQEIELPDFVRGEILVVDKLNLEDKETQPPKRYSQASLVKELEKRNLGTKSTRASIVQTLYDRNYIETQQIKVTNLGMHIVETLEKYAPDFLSEELTAKFEKEMELVEQDEKKREEVLEEVKELLTDTFNKFRKNEMDIGKALMGSVEETIEEQSNVGKCDKCDGNLKFIQMWNGSRFVGCSNYPKCKNGYPLPRNCGIEKIGKICEHCGTPILKII